MILFFRNCLKYKWVLIALVVVTVIANYFLVIRNHMPTYRSQTILLVSKTMDDTQELETQDVLQAMQVSERLVYDLPGIVFSSDVLRGINRELNSNNIDIDNYSMVDFRNQVTTEIITNSRIVEIEVLNNNPLAAQVIAGAIGDSTKQMVAGIYQQDYVHIIKEADLPENTHGLTRMHLWVVGIMGGILMGLLLVFLITLVKNNQQLEGEHWKSYENNISNR